ncbi:MAG: hypothetical protein ACI8W8_001085 [Rhodothermales bacterium]|jgi:hypothetical protein
MDCPEFDDLSAWHDGESDAPSIDAHIANCSDCQAALDSLEQMDHALVSPAPPEEILADIHAGAMRELRKPAPRPAPILSMQLLTRLAAMFALVGIALLLRDKLSELGPGIQEDLGQPSTAAMITHTTDPETPPAPPAAPSPVIAESANLPPPVPEAPANAIAESAPAPRLVRTTPPVSKPRTSVDYDAIKLVAAGPHGPRDLHSRQRGNIAAPAQDQVPDIVRHVWLAEDVNAPLKALRDLMPQDNRAKFDELAKESADSYSLTLSATDRNLQALVNHMSGIGMVLVSPDAPQPEGHGLRFSDKPVRYQVEFVKK